MEKLWLKEYENLTEWHPFGGPMNMYKNYGLGSVSLEKGQRRSVSLKRTPFAMHSRNILHCRLDGNTGISATAYELSSKFPLHPTSSSAHQRPGYVAFKPSKNLQECELPIPIGHLALKHDSNSLHRHHSSN